MSVSPAHDLFPRRTPVFTPVLVLLAFAVFAWLGYRFYIPRAYSVTPVAGVMSPADRQARLAEHRQKDASELGSYGWVDQKAGVVRLPVDRAIELMLKEHAKK